MASIMHLDKVSVGGWLELASWHVDYSYQATQAPTHVATTG